MSRKKITAIIPIRKGSQRIINKNFKPFAGKNLLEIKLDTLITIGSIDEIVVNTDSKRALEIAEKYGVKKHEREPYYASSKCNNSEFFEHMAKTTETDYLMYSPCTAPLVTKNTYYDIISRFINCLQNGYDSTTTVKNVKDHLWLEGKPLNYDPSNSPNTQDLPEILKLTYSVSIISRQLMIEKKNIIGNRPMFYLINPLEGVDIDEQYQFDFAEYLYKKNNNIF